MKNRLLITFAITSVLSTAAVQAENPYDFDIAGLKVGEKFEVNEYKEKFSAINEKFQFSSVVNKEKEVTGLIGQEKFSDSKLAYQLGSQHKERIFAYIGNDARIQQVARIQVLPPEEQITLGQLRAALTEKYGEPTEEGGYDVMNARWYGASWVYTPDGRKLDKNSDKRMVQECQRIYISPRPSSSQIYYATSHEQCGFIIQATYKDVDGRYFNAGMPDDAILKYYTVSMFDSKEAYKDVLREEEALAQKKEQALQNRLQQAQSNKPKL